MAVRITLLLLLVVASAFPDAEGLVRRAKTRMEHGNYLGAKALLEEALSEDPKCGPALCLYADLTAARAVTRLRYLAEGRPLDLDVARRFLVDLRERVVDLPEGPCLRAEREALRPCDEGVEACGPYPTWADPPRAPWPREGAGPLHGEAFGTNAHLHRDLLRSVAARFVHDGITDPSCWAGLAALLQALGDLDGAREAFLRCVPSSLDDLVAQARAALTVEADPHAWWVANSPLLLSGLASRGYADDRSPFERGIWEETRSMLAEAHDAASLARLADVEGRTWPGEDASVPFSAAVEALDGRWSIEEALASLESAEDASSVCLRGCLLLELLHIDEGIDTLEGLVRREPSCAPAWTALGRAYGRAERSTDFARCSQALRSLPQDASSFVDVKALALQHDGPEGLDDVAAAIGRQPRVTGFEVSEFCWIALRRGRPEVVLPLVERVHGADAWEWMVRPDYDTPPGLSVPGAVRLLRGLAADGRLSDTLDAFLRATWTSWSLPREFEAIRWKVRKELEGNAEFRRGPAAAYLLSLLCDPHFELREARALRRESFAAGFRSRGILEDLARDGEPVLDDLTRMDGATAELVAAIRSQGTEALARFLERDDAGRAQLEEAGWMLRRRGAKVESEEGGEEEDPARRTWNELQCDPECVAKAFLSKGLPDPGDLPSLVRYLPREYGYDWLCLVHRAVERHGASETLRALLEGPQAFLRARALLQDFTPHAGSLNAVVAEGLRHREDLRWRQIEADAAVLAGREDVRREAWDALYPLRRSQPSVEREAILHASSVEEKRAHLARYVEMRAADAPGDVLRLLAETLKNDNDGLALQVIEGLRPRCATPSDRARLVIFCSDCGLPGEAPSPPDPAPGVPGPTKQDAAVAPIGQEEWARRLAGEPDPVGRLRAFLSSFTTALQVFWQRDTVERVCDQLLAAKRTEEAVACADAWSDACGPTTSRDRISGIT